MISRLKTFSSQLSLKRLGRYGTGATLSLVSLIGCSTSAAQLSTLQPASALVNHLISRAAAVDTLISRVHQKLDDVHELEKATLTTAGLGPVRLGMTIQEAANAAQVSFVLAPMAQSPVCRYYLPETYGDDRSATPIDGIGLMVVKDQVIRIDIWPGSPVQTRDGLGIGSSADAVKAAYDAQIEVTPHPFTPGKYLTLMPEASDSRLYSLVFETDEKGLVTQFRSGQVPAVTWPEGCS